MGKLFLSFWDLCLDNLPEGSFAHRRIPPDEAKTIFEQARHEGRLFCVTGDDLLAPYKKRQCAQHEEFCRVLGEHFGIKLSLRDFAGNSGTEAEPFYSINPLNCVQLRDRDCLMVITCCFSLAEQRQGTEEPIPFTIAPSSVEFHLIEITAEPEAAQAAR